MSRGISKKIKILLKRKLLKNKDLDYILLIEDNMKKKPAKQSPLIYAALAAAFALCFTACGVDPRDLSVYSLMDAQKKLAGHRYGNSPDRAINLKVEMNLGDLSQPDNNYLSLLEVIGKSRKYVALDLSYCKTGRTTVFTSPPLSKAAVGMDKIVGIYFPSVTESIESDKNGRSPFFFYENLRRVETDNQGLTKIGNNAFNLCKSLESVSLHDVKTIGNEAFRGCENLKEVNLSSLKTIGDSAFFECSSFERIYLYYTTPPSLGNDVFLGSTPSDFVIIRNNESSDLFSEWLAENASKFNNDGKDIVLKGWQ